MERKYQSPEMSVIHVSNEDIMAGSLQDTFLDVASLFDAE